VHRFARASASLEASGNANLPIDAAQNANQEIGVPRET